METVSDTGNCPIISSQCPVNWNWILYHEQDKSEYVNRAIGSMFPHPWWPININGTVTIAQCSTVNNNVLVFIRVTYSTVKYSIVNITITCTATVCKYKPKYYYTNTVIQSILYSTIVIILVYWTSTVHQYDVYSCTCIIHIYYFNRCLQLINLLGNWKDKS